ncbi:MAG: aldehyde dehydrogenase [Euryarchaeota archaeon]|nr:aldehyde dehydrogenase [Euryarchaeota archaeon]
MTLQVQTWGHFVGGKLSAAGGETLDVRNPATGEVIAQVPKGAREDADAALDAARRAFEEPKWRRMDPSERGRILYRLGGLIREKADDLSRLETSNQGKPLRESKADVFYAAQTFEYFAGLCDKIQGDTIPVPGERLDYTLREPLGVTLHVAPWNFPFQLASRSVAPALAAGNTVVLKPASLTPLSAIRLGEIGVQAGLPPGVLNVVTGDGATFGKHLVESTNVDGVYLTGSVETGFQVVQSMGKKLKPFTLELGGKNPNIVFPDANLDNAVKGAALGAFMNAGQMCWAGSRILVHQSVHDAFVEAFKKRVEGLKVGAGNDPNTRLGPLVSAGQRDRVHKYVNVGRDEGAKVVMVGDLPKEGDLGKGAFLTPTIFDAVTPDMRIAKEEIFGPVVGIQTFTDYADAIKQANATQFGLYAGVWTKDLGTAHRAARDLEVGMVSVNEYPVTFPQTPFASAKNSGLGIEQSLYAIDHYTRIKNVSVKLD